jgi:hypothetical protein
MRFERLLGAPTLSQPDACGLITGETVPPSDNSKFRGQTRPRRICRTSAGEACPTNPYGIHFSLIANHLRTTCSAFTKLYTSRLSISRRQLAHNRHIH